jgi:hypothetical protein
LVFWAFQPARQQGLLLQLSLRMGLEVQTIPTLRSSCKILLKKPMVIGYLNPQHLDLTPRM